MERSASTCTRPPRCAVCRRTQSPKWRAAVSSMPATPSTSHAASAAMLAMTSLATRTLPREPFTAIQAVYPEGPGASPWLGPFHVGAGAGVDPYQIAWLDEKGDLDLCPGFERGRLGRPRYGVALEPRIGVHHLELHVDRQLNANELVLIAKQVR